MRWPEGLRAVALFEAAKGTLVILAGLGLLALVHADLQALAERLVRHTHLNPASHYPRIFLDAAAGLTQGRLLWLVLGALGYAAVRWIEAYGLWFGRRWAEWFAALSGGAYVPVELYELATRPGWLPAAALVLNVAIVALAARALYKGRPT